MVLHPGMAEPKRPFMDQSRAVGSSFMGEPSPGGGNEQHDQAELKTDYLARIAHVSCFVGGDPRRTGRMARNRG